MLVVMSVVIFVVLWWGVMHDLRVVFEVGSRDGTKVEGERNGRAEPEVEARSSS